MKNDKFKDTLKKHFNKKGSYAFIVGNGINRAYSNDNSWIDLLGKLIEFPVPNESKKTLIDLVSNFSKRCSLLEIYDIINFYAEIEEKEFRDYLVSLIEETYPVENIYDITQFRNALIKANYPILTTNYDKRFDTDLTCVSLPSQIRMPYRYPWNYCYINDGKIKKSDLKSFNPLTQFAVWHINGTVDKKYSIRLGIDDYAGLFARERKFYPGSDNYEKNHPKPTKNTWLDVFYKKPLCIVGLELGKDEVFLRHLLMKRYKYRMPENYKNTDKNASKDVFICMNGNEDAVDFLKLLKFEIISAEYAKPCNFVKMYNTIAETLNEIK